MFMGAQGVGRLGVMERDPLMVQSERKLIDQAEELVVLVDSSKFAQRSSLIVCPLERVHTIITDDGITDDVAEHARGRRREADRRPVAGQERNRAIRGDGMSDVDPQAGGDRQILPRRARARRRSISTCGRARCMRCSARTAPENRR